ncbi:Cyclin-dependent kinase 2, partial [Entomortierella beljakovae]
EVSHGHVAPVPVPVPGAPCDDESETNNGRGAHVPIPVPVGGPSTDDSNKQPSGPGGFIPGPGKTEYTEETTEEVTETIEEPESEASRGRTGLFGAIAGAAAGAGAYLIGKKRDDSPEKTTTVSGSTSTTVTTTKTGGRIYTTVGTGGQTVNTEYTETGAARHILTGHSSNSSTIRTITRRSESGEEFLVPVDGPDGEEREVITERDSNGKIRYIIGGIIAGAIATKIISSGSDSDSDSGSSRKKIIITRITTTTRIITETTSSGVKRYIITGDFNGNAIRVLTERNSSGETILVPTNESTGELHHVTTERDENGLIKYVIGGIIAGGIIRSTSEQSGGSITISSSTRIITERTSTGEIRYVIVGGFSGNAIRVLVDRTSSGETRLTPTNEETGELRQVITERSESGEIRYIVGGIVTGKTITRVIMGPRIISERTATGEFRYIIIDEYKGNAIRTKFERSEETGEFVHIPVKEPEGELRYVKEERTESGEIRKVIGAVITGKVATTVTRTEGPTTSVSSSSSSSAGSQVRIVAETNGSETRYFQITQGADGQEVRTVVERTEDGGFRIPGGAIVVAAGATMIGNNQQTTTTTRVVGGGTLTPAEQAANKTQITLKLSIMRYERADASAAVPKAAEGTVMFSKFKMLAIGDVNIDETAYSHVEETKTQARRTIKWMKTEAHWKREAGMLQHLKSDKYITDLYTLYSLPTFAEYRYVSILGSFNCTLESYLVKNQLTGLQIRQLTASLSDALRWCHDHHVVHLNIRPSSFYLGGVPGQDASGQMVWKLWNFGHARFVGEPVDTAVTTVTYAAPEILEGRKKGDASVLSSVSMDRWSLGLIIYEMHARKAYFPSSNSAEFQLTNDDGTKFEPALEVIKEVDARKAIRGLLEVDAEKRFTHETLREVYFGRV